MLVCVKITCWLVYIKIACVGDRLLPWMALDYLLLHQTDCASLDLVPRCDSPALLLEESPGHVDKALQAILVAGIESGQLSHSGQCGYTHA